MNLVYFVTSLLMLDRDKETTYLQKVTDKQGIESKLVAWEDQTIDWSEADLCIIRTPHDYILKLDQFIEWTKQVENQTTLWNPSKVIHWNSHKKYLIELQNEKVPVPPSILVEKNTSTNLSDLLENTNWGEFIIKPAVSIGAWGVKRFKQVSSEAQQHLDNVLIHGYEHVHTRTGRLWELDSDDAILQKFIPEVMTEGEASLVYLGGAYSHAVKKVPAEGEFRVHDVFGGQVLSYEATVEEKRVAEMALEAVGLETQYARIDTVETLEGPLIIEVELIEPRLYFEYHPDTAESYAKHIKNYFNR